MPIQAKILAAYCNKLKRLRAEYKIRRAVMLAAWTPWMNSYDDDAFTKDHYIPTAKMKELIALCLKRIQAINGKYTRRGIYNNLPWEADTIGAKLISASGKRVN